MANEMEWGEDIVGNAAEIFVNKTIIILTYILFVFLEYLRIDRGNYQDYACSMK